jgi:UDP-N-acetylglucosamine diphosphorylase/glucosamine-1-phosphate N-acetyltransferase
MNIILFDNNRADFFPLSMTRPISSFRFGILTIIEKWQAYFSSVSVSTEDYLSNKFPADINDDNIWVSSQVIPCQSIVTELKNLRKGESLKKDSLLIAFRNSEFINKGLNIVQSNVKITYLSKLTDIFCFNGEQIIEDLKLMFLDNLKLKGALDKLEKIKKSNIIIGKNLIYVEEGAKLEQCILNTTDGPIYIGKDAEIMEGSMIRGPFAMCNNSVVKMGTKIYGPTTIGPYCKVGGEINNSVFFGFSSKAHDGFLGNSVIGEWCNLGADTNNSNLKNNYENVKLWNYNLESFTDTELQFCGLIMGDHSKCGINSMFNTGTIIGVGVNIFGSGFPRNFIPSFSWGGASGFAMHKKQKFFNTVEKVMKRRDIIFSDEDKEILSSVYNMTKRYRNEK